jgi:hypothetical protein
VATRAPVAASMGGIKARGGPGVGTSTMATTVKDSVSAPMYFAPAARPMSTPRGTARRGVGARNNLINMASANTDEGSEKVVLLEIGASSRDCLNLGVFVAKSAERKINSTQRAPTEIAASSRVATVAQVMRPTHARFVKNL